MTVSPSTLQSDVFTSLRTLIIANLPTYTYNSTTKTYTLTAEYSSENPTLPEVVLNEAKSKLMLLTMDGSEGEYGVEVQMDFYAPEKHGQKAIGSAQSQLRNTFVGNITNFVSTDRLLPAEDFWEDSNVSPFENNNQILHTGRSIVRFKVNT